MPVAPLAHDRRAALEGDVFWSTSLNCSPAMRAEQASKQEARSTTAPEKITLLRCQQLLRARKLQVRSAAQHCSRPRTRYQSRPHGTAPTRPASQRPAQRGGFACRTRLGLGVTHARNQGHPKRHADPTNPPTLCRKQRNSKVSTVLGIMIQGGSELAGGNWRPFLRRCVWRHGKTATDLNRPGEKHGVTLETPGKESGVGPHMRE